MEGIHEQNQKPRSKRDSMRRLLRTAVAAATLATTPAENPVRAHSEATQSGITTASTVEKEGHKSAPSKGIRFAPKSSSWKSTIEPHAQKHIGDAATNPKRQPTLKQGPTLQRQGIRTPTEEDNAVLTRFLEVIEHMQGEHVQYRQGNYIEVQGFEQFCREQEAICERFAGGPDRVENFLFTPELFREIDRINREVNAKIKPTTDLELYGVVEKWTIPEKRGDCDDYVLLKEVLLLQIAVQRGEEPGQYIEPSKLRIHPTQVHIFVVLDENGERHAVLGIDVVYDGKKNTLVLDNKNNELRTLQQMRANNYSPEYMSVVTIEPNGTYKVRFFPFQAVGPQQVPPQRDDWKKDVFKN